LKEGGERKRKRKNCPCPIALPKSLPARTGQEKVEKRNRASPPVEKKNEEYLFSRDKCGRKRGGKGETEPSFGSTKPSSHLLGASMEKRGGKA